MKCYLYLTKTGGFVLTGDKDKDPSKYNHVWIFDAQDAEDATLKFNRFIWIYTHYKSETEAVKVFRGEEDLTLLPDYEWVENAVKHNNTFGALSALLAIKRISIREAQDEIHKILTKFSEQL